jgi:hypothetical protein
MGQAVGQRASSRIAVAIGVLLTAHVAASGAAGAADKPVLPPDIPPGAPIAEVGFFMPRPAAAWQADFAARYWFGKSKTAKTLYDLPSFSGDMVSRLTYDGLTTHTGEVFGRIAFTSGWFIKGYIGAGVVAGGNLQDEDFPPLLTPYSSTNSDQHNGFLTYASGDVGFNVVRGGDFRVGAFVGYHYFNEAVSAYGCAQTATNPFICSPAIPTTVEVITQNNRWHSLRVGIDGAAMLGDRFKLSAEAAWLPYVYLSGTDAHWLRIGSFPGDFTGPIPEDGTGRGYQLEAMLSYMITPNASVGIGARYWHMETSGNTHFEDHVVGFVAGPQPVDWTVDIYGVFVQASVKLDPYPLGVN